VPINFIPVYNHVFSMNRRGYLLWHRMRANGLDPTMRNRIVFNYTESLKHFLAKCLVSRILYRNGNIFLTEAPVSVGNTVNYIDVLDCTNGIAYEMQNTIHGTIKAHKNALYNAEMVKDVIIVKLKEISPNVYVAHKQLEKIVV